jgi:hypothetical protein
MYACIHVYMCIYIIYTHTNANDLYIYIYTYIYIYMPPYMSPIIIIHIPHDACLHAACMFAIGKPLCVCMCACVHVYTHTHTHTQDAYLR